MTAALKELPEGVSRHVSSALGGRLMSRSRRGQVGAAAAPSARVRALSKCSFQTSSCTKPSVLAEAMPMPRRRHDLAQDIPSSLPTVPGHLDVIRVGPVRAFSPQAGKKRRDGPETSVFPLGVSRSKLRDSMDIASQSSIPTLLAVVLICDGPCRSAHTVSPGRCSRQILIYFPTDASPFPAEYDDSPYRAGSLAPNDRNSSRVPLRSSAGSCAQHFSWPFIQVVSRTRCR